MDAEERSSCHLLVKQCQNTFKDGKVGWGGIRKEERDRGKGDLEEGKKGDGNNYQKHCL